MAINPLRLVKLSGLLKPRMPKAEPSAPNEFRPERVLKKKEQREIDKPVSFKTKPMKPLF